MTDLIARTAIVGTINGKPVTDAQLQEWADEAERGYDVSKLKLRGRPSMGDEPAKVTTLRLEPRLDAALSARAQREGSFRSEVIRAALRAWLESALGRHPIYIACSVLVP